MPKMNSGDEVEVEAEHRETAAYHDSPDNPPEAFAPLGFQRKLVHKRLNALCVRLFQSLFACDGRDGLCAYQRPETVADDLVRHCVLLLVFRSHRHPFRSACASLHTAPIPSYPSLRALVGYKEAAALHSPLP